MDDTHASSFSVSRLKNEPRRSRNYDKRSERGSNQSRGSSLGLTGGKDTSGSFRKQILNTLKRESQSEARVDEVSLLLVVDKFVAHIAFKELDSNAVRLWLVCEHLQTARKDIVARIAFRMGLAALEKLQSEGQLK